MAYRPARTYPWPAVIAMYHTNSTKTGAPGVEPIHGAVRRFLEARAAPHGAMLLAAVSGGADSLALLFALAELREVLGHRLTAAILHHGMRDEADADVAMLQGVCDGMAVPLEVGRADVPAMAAARKISLEVAGREARYAFLYETAARCGAHALCTGHTLDDQAETVLLRVIFGTGLEGLGGIPPERRVQPPESLSPVWLWRPLLEVSRAGTQEYCAARGLNPVRDPANADPRYPRNRIRHDLLPRLERDYNPAIREALARLADLARAEETVLADLADSVAAVRTVAGGGARVHIQPLLALPLAMRRRVARLFLRAAGGSGRALGFANVERLLDAMARGEARRHLDGGLEMTRDGEHATLRPIGKVVAPEPFEIPLAVPGQTMLPVGALISEILPGGEVSESGPFEADLDADAVDAPLLARGRRAGDRMRPLGMAGTRKLSDLMADRKVPREIRDTLPVVVCGDRIAWVVGVAVSEEFRLTPNTRRRLHLRVTPALFATP